MNIGSEPAFPVIERIKEPSTGAEYDQVLLGSTIRQWYKGQAIKLFVLDRKDVKDLQADRTPDHNCTSKFCGDLADAMIREDEEHTKGK